MNDEEIAQGSLWTHNKSKPKRAYCVLESNYEGVVAKSNYEGVVATTSIDISTDKPDSFIWLSPVEDFLNAFTPLKSK